MSVEGLQKLAYELEGSTSPGMRAFGDRIREELEGVQDAREVQEVGSEDAASVEEVLGGAVDEVPVGWKGPQEVAREEEAARNAEPPTFGSVQEAVDSGADAVVDSQQPDEAPLPEEPPAEEPESEAPVEENPNQYSRVHGMDLERK